MRRPSLPDVHRCRSIRVTHDYSQRKTLAYRSFRRGLATCLACPTLISKGCNRAKGGRETLAGGGESNGGRLDRRQDRAGEFGQVPSVDHM
ncbi:unnamed protein product [Ciceribacter selenitireducens ATCC BAA-1503]|uniref:Uncharacterized protein n=1 Tax=Ciceribacter selenitireducens ATCC BAA-1503 TaxID=1336235 RepID=A0A376AJU5_9HYPH|nr:unnamed protein product [Ciceribacter selenitireducens ATCC BAA-1503]